MEMILEQTMILLEQKRAEGVLATPPPALTTTRKDRAMAANELPDHQTLRKLLDYDPATGLLIWLHRDSSMFREGPRQEWACSIWNRRYAGWPAFTASSRGGYKVGTMLDQCVLAHRIIWKWMTGEDADCIDHINGDPGDNRWANLRNTDAIGNARNIGRSKANTSGAVGVRYRSDSDRWIAFIGTHPHQHLGSFRTKEEAIAARLAAEREMGFSENHGRRKAGAWQ